MTDTWGKWHFEADARTLTYDPRGIDYEVDIDTCLSAAAVLDWIVQVSNKTWATPADIGHLVHALDDLLRVQAIYCTDRTPTVKDVGVVLEYASALNEAAMTLTHPREERSAE